MRTATRVTRWVSPVRVWAGHACDQVTMTTFIVAGFLLLTIHGRRLNPWTLLVVVVAGLVPVMTTQSQRAYHNHRPCLHCIRRIPLNPGVAVGRRARELRWYHQRSRIRGISAVSAVLVVAAVAVPRWARTITGVELLIVSYLLLIMSTHARLHPWCPRCHPEPLNPLSSEGD